MNIPALNVGETEVLAPNVPAMLEAHYGVPMAGAVLNALNVRLDAATIGFILEHGAAKALLTDRVFSPTIKSALEQTGARPIVIDIPDPGDTGVFYLEITGVRADGGSATLDPVWFYHVGS